MYVETNEALGDIKVFRLKNVHNMEVHILNLGGIITKIITPNKNGIFENIVLGYKENKDYETDPNFFGAIIGRVAGRIKEANFQIDGKKYLLERNDGKNHLHGGTSGFHRVIWDSELFETADATGVKLSYFSENGENGYPGNLNVVVTYTLNNDNQLMIEYGATTDENTVLTLTNHSYFNLSGNMKDTVHNHHVTMNSSKFVELNKELIPTGNIRSVTNTLFDFQQGRKLRDGLTAGLEQNKIVGDGYDHYFIFDEDTLGDVVVKDESSGRILRIQTNQPGMVMYTANNLEEGNELAGGLSKKYQGVCFETQASPESLEYEGFPSVRLNDGELYKKQTLFTFDVE